MFYDKLASEITGISIRKIKNAKKFCHGSHSSMLQPGWCSGLPLLHPGGRRTSVDCHY